MCPTIRSMNPLNRFKKGSILVHILYHASKNTFYGSWLKEELARHGYDISYGTLYPWLARLEISGYLVSEEKTVEGKNRKYYFITKKGLEILEEMKLLLKELIKEVIENK
ncbi:MAG: PadR family transcriptional regulator [Promethearchaeota archaeon]